MKLYCFMVMNGFDKTPTMYVVGEKHLKKFEKKKLKSLKKKKK
jgi:hypothetical protein